MRSVLIVCSMALLAACAGERQETYPPQQVEVQRYMSEKQLTGAMGAPDRLQQDGTLKVLQYKNRLISNWSSDRSDYSFIFDQGRLVEYTPGRVQLSTVDGVRKISVEPM
ncbi:hypothetical protein IQ22_01665 [Pseudomonas duriflava]|uniref:Lipoprotein n=1 Tax=Pseudomonas duriflava TaxID=459528 RepID=A0A562QG51_9PSED|nr:hypothetical protein [Pseudomonas duriflava]TWI55732.1 hypothetical protein IQ22_01665 [Pseudomonas duriflava]